MGQKWNQGRNQRYFESHGNENVTIQNLWDTEKVILKLAVQAFSKKKKKKKTWKSSNKQFNSTLKGTWKRTTKKSQISRRKDGPREHYAEWNKPVRERQIHMISLMYGI